MIYLGFIRSPSSSNLESAKVFFKKAIRDGLEDFFDTHGFDYECQLESEPRARLILSHLCSFESDPPKHRSSNDPDGRSRHSYQEYMI